MMANRKELPREKKLKQKIADLEYEIEAKKLDIERLQGEARRDREIRESLNDSVHKLNEVTFTQQQILSKNELELERQTKLINFLIDSKL